MIRAEFFLAFIVVLAAFLLGVYLGAILMHYGHIPVTF